MLRPNIRNRTFDWMGEKYAPIIDPYHFLGRSSLNPVWGSKKPYVNILKKGGKIFEMEVSVPGFKKKEINISIADDVMTIKGKKKKLKKRTNSDYVLKEFEQDSFERKFKLAKNIGHEKVKAKYRDGILRIRFFSVPTEEEVAHKEVAVV